MTIRCITFDLDDTLWATGPVINAAEKVAHDWLEQYASSVLAGRSQSAMTEHRREFYQTLPHLRHDFTALRRAWLAHLFEEAGLPATMSEEAFMAFWRARNAVTPFPSALNVLARLRARFLLGTITNGNASVAHIGLDHHFEFCVTAGDAGVAKPDPDIFHYALGQVDVAPHEAVHIGDDPCTDVHGALRCGMHAIWVNASGRDWDDTHGAPPHATISSVGELEPVLDALLDELSR